MPRLSLVQRRAMIRQLAMEQTMDTGQSGTPARPGAALPQAARPLPTSFRGDPRRSAFRSALLLTLADVLTSASVPFAGYVACRRTSGLLARHG